MIHPQKIKFINFVQFLWVIFALLDPDPGTPFNPDPIRIWIRIHNTGFDGITSDAAPGTILLFVVQAKDKKDIGHRGTLLHVVAMFAILTSTRLIQYVMWRDPA
jgi:hypothetical protein